ncbi:MAG: hypothetical protein V4482_04335 [Pseudomonadota bacterium]
MRQFICIFLIILVCASVSQATQKYTSLSTTQTYFSTQISGISTKADRELAESAELSAKSISYANIESSEHSRAQYIQPNIAPNHVHYDDTAPLRSTEEAKSTVYYSTPMRTKGILSRFFVGDHISARMDTFHNSEIPFLARSNGVATEVSTQSTNLSASYFKESMQNTLPHNTASVYKKNAQPLSGDTKFALAVPYFPKLKLFGGYSYSRNVESRLTRGPSFGFQANMFDYVKIDTTFVKPSVGKTAAKVLFNFNMPLELIRF